MKRCMFRLVPALTLLLICWLPGSAQDKKPAVAPLGSSSSESILHWEGVATDDKLAELQGKTGLRYLFLSRSKVTDDGLKHLKGLVNLQALFLNDIAVTDAGLTNLSGLTKLQVLYLNGTKVTETGFKHLKPLTQLTTLGLGGMQISEAVFEHLKTMTKLQELSLMGPAVTDARLKQLREMTRLQTLNLLQGNNVTDAGLEHLKELSLLNRLTIYSTFVTDAGLKHLRNLTSLRHLYLFVPVTDAGLLHLKNLANLQTLILSGEVTDAGLEHLQGFKDLRMLQVQGSGITPEGLQRLKTALPQLRVTHSLAQRQAPQASATSPVATSNAGSPDSKHVLRLGSDDNVSGLKGRTDLRELRLDVMRITDAGLAPLKEMTKLKTLELISIDGITVAGLDCLKGLTQLEELSLDRTNVTDAGLVHLKGLVNLQTLNLEHTATTAAGLVHLKGMTKLRMLSLGHTSQADGSGLEHLKGLTNLQTLMLGWTQVDDQGLQHVAGLSNLQTLKLTRTKITDAGLKHLEGMTKLRKLDVMQNNITDAGLISLSKLTGLQTLYLNATGVTDAGLEHLKEWTELREFGLGSGRPQITGAGLAHLKKTMPNLEYLSLNGHSITDARLGLVPWRDMPNLRKLDFSYTKITGAGLEQLKGIDKLEDLNLGLVTLADDDLRHLQNFPNLQQLKLNGDPVTDAGLVHLQGLKKLKSVYLRGTRVTEAGVRKLRMSMPQTVIDWDRAGQVDQVDVDPKKDNPPMVQVKLPKLVNSIGTEFVLIPPGKFKMGSAGNEHDEKQHNVEITKPFYLGVYEVTQEQYEKVMNKNPSYLKEASNPVEMVSWEDARTFCVKLTALPAENEKGRVYRLPTEAEWEYACRAGSKSAYGYGDDAKNTWVVDAKRLGQYAWFNANSGSKTHAVGQKKPNAWGLFDMHGNCMEWIADWHEPYDTKDKTDPQGPQKSPLRVVRGGSWNYDPYGCRSANRVVVNPAQSGPNIGFRVVCVVAARTP